MADACALCGQAEGHSVRCSVTRHGADEAQWRMPMADTCPTCGQAVDVVTSGEGTSHYIGIDAWDANTLRTERDMAVASATMDLRRQLTTAYDAIREMAEADTVGEVRAIAANGPLATAPGGPKEDECFRLREALRQAVAMLYRDDWTPEERDALEEMLR